MGVALIRYKRIGMHFPARVSYRFPHGWSRHLFREPPAKSGHDNGDNLQSKLQELSAPVRAAEEIRRSENALLPCHIPKLTAATAANGKQTRFCLTSEKGQ